MPPRTDPRAGFMLVEVLAALVVTAALVATVLPFAGQLIARWQAGQGSVAQADAWMRAVARLTDDIAEALPVHDPAIEQPTLGFTVAPSRVDLIRNALGGTGAPALERVSYRVEGGAGGQRLVRRTQPLTGGRLGEARASVPSTITMIEGPYTFRFSATDKDGARTSGWASTDAMPMRLDLTVTPTAGGRVPFSPLALPLAARANMVPIVPMLRHTP